MKQYFIILAGFFTVFSTTAFADPLHGYTRVQSGTGFFVNHEYIITNAHVVKGCTKATIKGAVTEEQADVQVIDEQHDLALLRSTTAPLEFAPLRINIEDLKKGDHVFVIGYPGVEGAKGEYKIIGAQVQSLGSNIINGNPERFYITDVVQHGNSGGPVFDSSGNVIGVVVAMSTISTVNAQTMEKVSEQQVGVVITLATLKDFLLAHGAYTEWGGSYLAFDQGYVEDHAKHYIVNVQCLQSE